jgi:prostaglandin-endoperoxide synthase 2
VNIVLLLRIIIEDYINHLSDVPFKFIFDNTFASGKRWYRTNRIALEFDLLYRWHSQVPDKLTLDGADYDEKGYMYNNVLLEKLGVERVLKDASKQSAGRIYIRNTPAFLVPAEKAALNLARTHRVRPYNEYRERFGMSRCKSFEALTGSCRGSPSTDSDSLRALYGHVDNVEFLTGLFAERHSHDGSLGDLMRTMVAVDAFSHALTNPLLADDVFNADTLSEVGLEIIHETASFEDIVRRNKPPGTGDNEIFASFSNDRRAAERR